MLLPHHLIKISGAHTHRQRSPLPAARHFLAVGVGLRIVKKEEGGFHGEITLERISNENQGNGAVVGQAHLHIGTESAGLNGYPQVA